jgi:flagellar P-ring protein precursor FlgI
VSHGSLTVTITENFDVSQPSSFTTFGSGQTVVTPRTDIEIDDSAARMFPFGPGTSLEEIVRAVNDVGAAPGDLVAILEALYTLGALRAELIVI